MKSTYLLVNMKIPYVNFSDFKNCIKKTIYKNPSIFKNIHEVFELCEESHLYTILSRLGFLFTFDTRKKELTITGVTGTSFNIVRSLFMESRSCMVHNYNNILQYETSVAKCNIIFKNHMVTGSELYRTNDVIIFIQNNNSKMYK